MSVSMKILLNDKFEKAKQVLFESKLVFSSKTVEGKRGVISQ